jgi:hypothetical protein
MLAALARVLHTRLAVRTALACLVAGVLPVLLAGLAARARIAADLEHEALRAHRLLIEQVQLDIQSELDAHRLQIETLARHLDVQRLRLDPLPAVLATFLDHDPLFHRVDVINGAGRTVASSVRGAPGRRRPAPMDAHVAIRLVAEAGRARRVVVAPPASDAAGSVHLRMVAAVFGFAEGHPPRGAVVAHLQLDGPEIHNLLEGFRYVGSTYVYVTDPAGRVIARAGSGHPGALRSIRVGPGSSGAAPEAQGVESARIVLCGREDLVAVAQLPALGLIVVAGRPACDRFGVGGAFAASWIAIAASWLALRALSLLQPGEASGARVTARPQMATGRANPSGGGAWVASVRELLAAPLVRSLAMTQIGITGIRYLLEFLFADALARSLADEAAMAGFAGSMDAGVSVATILVQLTLSARVLMRFRVGGAAMITPGIVCAGTLVAWACPDLPAAVACQFTYWIAADSFHKPARQLMVGALAPRLAARVPTLLAAAGMSGSLAASLLLLPLSIHGGSAAAAAAALAASLGLLAVSARVGPQYSRTLAGTLEELCVDEQVKVLAQVRDGEQRLWSATLAALLDSPDEEVRVRTIREIGTLAPDDASGLLSRRLAVESGARARAALLSALTEVDPAAASAPALAALAELVRHVASAALGLWTSTAASEALAQEQERARVHQRGLIEHIVRSSGQATPVPGRATQTMHRALSGERSVASLCLELLEEWLPAELRPVVLPILESYPDPEARRRRAREISGIVPDRLQPEEALPLALGEA